MHAHYRTTFHIQDRTITQTTDDTQTLQALAESRAYVGALVNGIYTILDMARLQMKTIGNLDESQTIKNFLENHLTDLQKDTAAVSDVIPLRHLLTKRFTSRIEATDALGNAEIQVSYTSMRTPDIRDDIYHREWANDLVISSAVKPLDNCLVSVNGLFHRTVHHNSELYVAGGYANMKRAQMTETALYDTATVGGHTTIPITEEMVSQITDVPLAENFYIDLPDGVSLTGKTLAMVLHGKLMIFDGSYRIVSPTRIKVLAHQIDIPHLIMHHPLTKYSRNYRAPGFVFPGLQTPQDPGFLPPLYDDTNLLYANPLDSDGIIDYASLTSDSMITNLLTDGQSFLIIFNNDRLYTRKYNVFPTYTPGQYETTSEDTPRGILRYNHMWCLPYTILTAKDRQHTFTVAARRLGDDLYKTMLDPGGIPAPWLDTFETQRKPHVELLEIYTA